MTRIRCEICKKWIYTKGHNRKYCKKCQKIAKKQGKKKWQRNNPEKVREILRRYYIKNRKKVLKQTKEWAKKNKNKLLEYNREYNKRPEVIKRRREKWQRKKQLWENLPEEKKTELMNKYSKEILGNPQYKIPKNYKQRKNRIRMYIMKENGKIR